MTAADQPLVIGIPNGVFAENSWLLADPGTGEAAVVDPGQDHQLILGTLRAHGLRAVAIWLTHAHLDHIWGVDELRAATGAPAWLPAGERDWYDRFPEQGVAFGVAGLSPLAPPDHEMREDDELAIGRFRFRVRPAPGHSPGHVVLVGHGLCVAGDVIFEDSIGRTDLPGGDAATLLATIRREILSLPDDTRLLPGHGPATTVGRERRHNPFLQPSRFTLHPAPPRG